MVRDMLSWYEKNPDDWQKSWQWCEKKYRKNPKDTHGLCSKPGGENDFSIHAKLNGAYIIMGLLHGKGHPDQTIIISTRCGQDSDGNPANAGGVLFTTMGSSKLPERFTSALDPKGKFSHTPYDFPTLIEVSKKLVRQAVERSGGQIEKTSEGQEVCVIPVMAPQAEPAETVLGAGAGRQQQVHGRGEAQDDGPVAYTRPREATMKTHLLLVLAAALCCGPASANEVMDCLIGTRGGNKVPYKLSLPDDYASNARDYPSLIYLHGIGGRGTDLKSPLGNGRRGCMIFGGVGKERIQFNVDRLWTGDENLVGKERGVSHNLSHLAEGIGLCRNFGNVYISRDDHKGVEKYRCQLDLSRAVHTVSYTKEGVRFARETFCSYPPQVIVMRLEANGPGRYSGSVVLQDAHEAQTVAVRHLGAPRRGRHGRSHD